MPPVAIRCALPIVAALLLLSAVLPQARAVGSDARGRGVVLEAPIEGAIDPVTVEFVDQVLAQARADDVRAVVFTMDTPGGLSTSMDAIVKRFLNADDVPVIVYVGPRGARAASAGTFILYASDVAAMAPSTNVGSATPVQGSGEDIDGAMGRKVRNDAVAKLRAIAVEHGRNPDFAEAAITKAQNIDAEEARRRNVIEFVAPSLDDLLEQVDGYRTEPKGLDVRTDGAVVRRVDEPLSLRLLKFVIDPNLLFLLFTAGTIGLAFELTHPGVVLPGVVGAICLIVALFGMQVLPVNAAGAALLALALVLFALEVAVTSHGVLGIGGAVAMFLGGLLLFDRDSPYRIDVWLLAMTAVLFALFFGVLLRKVLAARRAPAVTGAQWLVGAQATVRAPLDPIGTVFVRGELWKARLRDEAGAGAVPTGAAVEVLDMDGLVLDVRPTAGSGAGVHGRSTDADDLPPPGP